MKTKILVMAFLGIMIYSCSPKVVPSTEPKKVELSAELAEGKSLYENNCGKCHKLYETNAYSAEQWKPIVERMKKKAKISDADAEKVYNYITMK